MKISLIIPCLDEAARLPALLGQVGDMGFWEILVVDGGSEDDSAAIVQAHPRARLLRAPRGRARQMNAGAEAATGEALFFLHADARPPPDAAPRIREALSARGVVGGAFLLRTVPEGGGHKPWLRAADLRSRVTRTPYGDQGLFMTAAAFRAAGGYPEQPLMEDWELSRRLRRLGRLARVRAEVEVSGRRFEAQPLRSLLFMRLAPLLYRAGVSPEWLKQRYADIR